MSSPIALILGAGSGVGRSVSSKLKQEGYKVAIASRNLDVAGAKANGLLPITVNVQSVLSIGDAFKAVHESFGAYPNVVVFNAASHAMVDDPLSSNISDIQAAADLQVGLFAAAKEAVAGFRELNSAGSTLPKIFIFTGNSLPYLPATSPPFNGAVILSWQKRSGIYFIELFAASYEKEGFRFYFGDQNTAEGKVAGPGHFSGEAHSIAYWDLIQKKEQGNWYYRFGEDGKELPGRDKL